MLDLKLGTGAVRFQVQYRGDPAQPIDPNAIRYTVSFRVPVGRQDGAEPIERPDPLERLP